MTDRLLTEQQLTVISALSTGATLTAAAQQAGVHRHTISNWRRNSSLFRDTMADAQYDRALFFRAKIEELFDVALETLEDILTDAEAPANTKLRAALTILQTAAVQPVPQFTVPAQPRQQTGADLPASAEDTASNPAPAPTTSSVANSAQPKPPAQAQPSAIPIHPPASIRGQNNHHATQ